MKKLGKYIFMLCPFCKRMSIIERQSYHPKEALIAINACYCTSEEWPGEEYYGKDGQIEIDPETYVHKK